MHLLQRVMGRFPAPRRRSGRNSEFGAKFSEAGQIQLKSVPGGLVIPDGNGLCDAEQTFADRGDHEMLRCQDTQGLMEKGRGEGLPRR